MTKLTSANICQLSAIGQMNKEIGILTYKLRQDYLGEQRTLSLPPQYFRMQMFVQDSLCPFFT